MATPETLIALANDYPFLDPFAAKFSYQDGKVSFNGDVKKNFSQGIGDGLWRTVEILAEQAALEGKDFFGSLRESMDVVNTNYQDQIDRFNFRSIIPNLFSDPGRL